LSLIASKRVAQKGDARYRRAGMGTGDPPSEFITAKEIKQRMACSLSVAYKLMDDLGAVKFRDCLRLERAVFERFVENLKKEGDEKRALRLTLERSTAPAQAPSEPVTRRPSPAAPVVRRPAPVQAGAGAGGMSTAGAMLASGSPLRRG
jgi:hypothetical protein